MFSWLKNILGWNVPEKEKEPEVKYLVAALGNIGIEYKNTRHNIGFRVANEIAEQKELTFQTGKYVTKTDFRFKGRTIHVIKPTTYMNLSGKAVKYWLEHLKIPVENLLVVVDDLDLPFGKLRLKKKGSPGSHNGLKDIQAKLGHGNYCRLRFGIGDDFKKGQLVDFVLGKWDRDEEEKLEELMKPTLKFIYDFVTIGPDRAMNENNKKKSK